MTKYTNKYLCIFFIITYLFLCFIFVKKLNPTRKIELKNNLSLNETIIVQPIIKDNNQYLYNKFANFPYVSARVGSIRYFPSLISEEIYQQKNNQKDLVYTFAGKRLSELELWGKQFQVIGTIKNITQLKNWWAKQNPNIWKIYKYKNYNIWEASLARYYILWEREINNLYHNTESKDLIDNLTTLKGYLINHKQRFATVVYDSKKTAAEKNYLFNLYNLIYDEINKKLSEFLPEYNFGIIYYPISEFIGDKQSGVYDVSLSLWDIPSFLNLNPRLIIENKIVSPKLLTNNTVKFKNVIVTSREKELKLQIDNTSFPVSNKITSKSFDEKTKLYQIDISIPKLPRDFNYYLKVNFNVKQRVILQINKKLIIKNKIYPQVIFNRDLFPVNQPAVLFEPVSFDYNYDHFFSILSYQPLSKSDFKSFSIKFQPLIDMDIVLKKIAGTSIDKNTVTTRSYSSSRILLFFILFALPIGFLWIFKKFKSTIQKKLLKLFFILTKQFYLLRIKIRQARLVFILFIIIIFIVNLFFTKNNSFSMTILAIIFWVLCVVNYNLEVRITFLFAALLLGLCIIFSIIGVDLTAEKMAIWFYMFLIMALDQYIFESVINKNIVIDLMTFKNFPPQIKQDLNSLKIQTTALAIKQDLNSLKIQTTAFANTQQKNIRGWLKTIYVDFKSLKLWGQLKKKVLDPIFNNFIKEIVFFYIPCSKKQKDVQKSVNRIGITLIIVFAYFIIHYLISRSIAYERLSPTIYKIEPKIVYHATNVIVKGNNFGWRLKPSDKLMSQYGEISTSLWDISKIIFVIPLHWKPGKINLWIERESSWNSRKIVVRSNIISIKLLSISSIINKDDEEYFNQLKWLDKETLKLNGY